MPVTVEVTDPEDGVEYVPSEVPYFHATSKTFARRVDATGAGV